MNNEITNLIEYLKGPELWVKLAQGALKIVFILLLMLIIVKISNRLIERFFTRKQHGTIRISERRENTLKKLIQNMVSYVAYFTAFIMILEVFTINIGALLAGAGVAGLAIGFGAQNLVRDVISGFFIIFEDQFSVGDYVVVSGAEGTVEEIGIRTTKVKSWTGEMNVIPNGNITQVVNYSVRNGLSVVDVNIPYEDDVERAEQLISEIIATLPEKYEEFVSTPTIHGVQVLDTSHYVIRVIAETQPVYQWFGERVIRKEIKDKLYQAGIDIPSPRLVLYHGREEAEGPIQRAQEE